jgi:hypothetical protein
MITITIDPTEGNDASTDGGYAMRVWRNGNLIFTAAQQSHANIHDAIEVAEGAFGYGKGTSETPGWCPPDTAMEPVELVIRRKTQPVETRRLR